MNTPILKVHLKYTSEFECIKYINLESPLEVYFWVWKKMHLFKKYTFDFEFDNKYINFESLPEYTSDPEKKYKCVSKTCSKYIWSILHY